MQINHWCLQQLPLASGQCCHTNSSSLVLFVALRRWRRNCCFNSCLSPSHLPTIRTRARMSLPSLFVLLLFFFRANASTDSQDVSALNVMYSSLNSPSKLTGWKSTGGDPCGDNWKGITCSGSSVTKIKLSGLGLTGSMGYQLSSLTSVTSFDLSNNKIQGDIPYQLPPNVVSINLSGNKFSGTVPYSVSQMSDLQYLNLGDNQLNGQLTDMFGKLPSLSTLDLSSNRITGALPSTFASLKKLKTLHLQNNKFTGTINVLSALKLEDLNIADNHFSGWIPNSLKNLDNLKTEGNSWSTGQAPPHSSKAADVSERSTAISNGKGLGAGAIAGIVIGALAVIILLLTLLTRRKSSPHSLYIDEESVGHNRSFTPLVSHELKDFKSVQASSGIQMKSLQISPSSGLKLPPSDWHKSFNDNEFASKMSSRRSTDPVPAVVYSLSDMLSATANFAASRLLSEGSIGRVYKGKATDGKTLAVKKINSSSLTVSSTEGFMELVNGISRLHHPNITELIGYCSEPSYHLLVYEFQINGSLHDFLHLSDDYSKPLTWDTRVRIALGTARAVEYLHEVCSPSAVHKNIKSANILLDAELNPNLSDCGLTVFYQDTTQNLGPGYNAPECTTTSSYSLKSDVYSFGVVMLELLTGRVPFDSSKSRSEQSLVRWAMPQLHDIDALSKMVDPALRGLYPPKALSRFADVIALCVQAEPEFRPPMSEVVQALVRCVQRPSLSTSRRSDDSDYY